IEHCAMPTAGGRTPSDFPLARLGQPVVDELAGDGRSVQDIYPLTPLQAGMLFHSLVDGDSGVYVDQARMLLDGVSDPVAFGAAWQRVVDRTPALRSRLVWEGVDEPLQVVERKAAVPTTFHDYLSWLADQDEGQAEEYWRRMLSGFESPTALPCDRQPVQAHRTQSSETVRVALSGDRSARLRAVAKGNGLTLNSIVQGAWA